MQEKIRQTLFTHEPISALKAFMAVNSGLDDWNKLNPPLQKINNPSNHKTIISLKELIKRMDDLIPSA